LLIEEIQHFVTGTREAFDHDRVLASVLFVDIVDSTETAARMGDAAWRDLLDRFDERATRAIHRHRGTMIKSTGDGFLARFDGPARAVRCAMDLREAARPLDLEIRSGLHTGECEIMPKDIGGMAVHIASRVCDLAGAGEVLVSRTIKDLVVGSGLRFADRGAHTLKGVEDAWELYSVEV
jgi:class 3 adenylate cyclase